MKRLLNSYCSQLLKMRYAMGLDLFFGPVDKEFVSLCHLHNIDVNVWTVDDPADGERLTEWGVDYLTSNILQ